MANNKVKFLRGTAAEYANTSKDDDAIYFTTDDNKLYIGDKEITGKVIIIDTTLSDTSENAVQGKVIKAELDKKADKVDIPTSLPANGGDADTLDGKHASDFATANSPRVTGDLIFNSPTSDKTISAIYSTENVLILRNTSNDFSTVCDMMIRQDGVYVVLTTNDTVEEHKIGELGYVTGTFDVASSDTSQTINIPLAFDPVMVLLFFQSSTLTIPRQTILQMLDPSEYSIAIGVPDTSFKLTTGFQAKFPSSVAPPTGMVVKYIAYK